MLKSLGELAKKQKLHLYEIFLHLYLILLENQMLKIASEAKSDFLSRMSHDMRTPMNVILGMSAYSLEIKPKKEELLEYMEKIRISGEYLLTLINDTLDMSKIEKHKMELNYEPIRIPEILLILESVIGAKADEKKIHISRHFLNCADSSRRLRQD